MICPIIQTEFQDPSIIVLKHAKLLHEVNILHHVHLLKITSCMRDTVINPSITHDYII